MYKPTIHDGSVSYSVMLPDPPEGTGKPMESSQMTQDTINRHLKKSMNRNK